MAKQIEMFGGRVSKECGGVLVKGKRKGARPIATRRAMHLVFRSETAKGELSLLLPRHAQFIQRCLGEGKRKFAVRVYRLANVGNHLHLCVLARTRKGLQDFLRWLP